MKQTCDACFRSCVLTDGQTGACKARMNQNGEIICTNYGHITSIALDPIEKKPLYHFCSGGQILSVGSYGCNLACSFCQNSSISAFGKEDNPYIEMSPEELVDKALVLKPRGNVGIAYTYNEPLIGYEFVRDTATLAKAQGLKNIIVTNGCFTDKVLEEILPCIDAMNVDLKGFTSDYYNQLGGSLEATKNFIKKAFEYGCHLEVTTLVVPSCNDTDQELEEMASWIASISPEIPYHLSRFFPRWKMMDKEPTEIEAIYHSVELAKKHLKYVYAGNV